ncbi:hypothetical protein DAH66_03655 [Sphingomonas koreensis]|uniref:Lipoprotein n=1 Tax=Sphingomonas koreensis TaxID=93064 RepID=A0A430G899_9SPHN|nr:hypothetical protein [Sphingomonas koreensis]RSY89750.1 hypothetical protein DAH66_03655 [Sphingomonas koreensis]
MADFKRLSLILMTSVAGATLAACDGASSVASPGPGTIVVPPGGGTPTPTPPTPTPSPTASFAQTAQSGITVTQDEQLTVFNAGTNNTVAGSNPLNGLIPQGAAASVTPFNASTLNSFFVNTSFIGAIGGAGDTAFQNWTCSSSTANFTGTGSIPATNHCITSLARSAAAPAASACPAGTTDAGTSSNYRLCRLPALVSGTVTLDRVDGVAYQINGRVDVGVDVGTAGTGGAAATLNIGAGALFVANNGDAANDFLVVNRGSKMNAVGTASAPIIFTSTQNLSATGTSDSSQGQWGGIILAGRAPISDCGTSGTRTSNDAGGTNANCENVVEGTGNALYGGNIQNDSSGTIQYVQIRYSGTEISLGNELQGLTLGGTGSGTVIDHVQVHNSSDDGIEVFGGTTNMKYLAITGADDDGLDTDVGWRGFIQFAIVIQKTIGATSDSFATEIDSNNNEDFLPRQFGRLANFTFIQTANAPAAIRLRGGADYTFVNGIVKAVGPCLNIVAGTEANGGKSTIRAANAALQEEGPPKFNSVYFACNGA